MIYNLFHFLCLKPENVVKNSKKPFYSCSMQKFHEHISYLLFQRKNFGFSLEVLNILQFRSKLWKSTIIIADTKQHVLFFNVFSLKQRFQTSSTNFDKKSWKFYPYTLSPIQTQIKQCWCLIHRKSTFSISSTKSSPKFFKHNDMKFPQFYIATNFYSYTSFCIRKYSTCSDFLED